MTAVSVHLDSETDCHSRKCQAITEVSSLSPAPHIVVPSVWFSLARQILFPMEYAPVFCGTNLLSLDEIQVNGEGDGNTEMIRFSDICSDNDDSEVVIEDISDHSLGGYSARCSKVGKATVFFRFPSKAKQILFYFIFFWA